MLEDIEGYGSKYQLDRESREVISNTSWHKGKPLTPFLDRHGYRSVGLVKEGKKTIYRLKTLFND